MYLRDIRRGLSDSITEATDPLISLIYQLEDSQWLSQEALLDLQRQQLVTLATYLDQHSKHFHRKLASVGLLPADLAAPGSMQRIPVLTRREIQATDKAELFCDAVPKSYLPIEVKETSGSTGEPVRIVRTQVNMHFYCAIEIRASLWHSQDLLGTSAYIRTNLPVDGASANNWGQVYRLFRTGSKHGINVNVDTDKQIEWLERVKPSYLVTYPTKLFEIVRRVEEKGIKLPSLLHVRTVGETVTPELRQTTHDVLGVDIVDAYSAEEVGTAALQCPDSGLYHVMESFIVEVLDDNGNLCTTGQVGRVAITDLHNVAAPIVRYIIGDYAEVGPACSCGRGLPTLKRILGRQRNMLRMPDGSRRWLWLPLGDRWPMDIAPVRQYQLVQYSEDSIEVRMAANPSDVKESALTRALHNGLGYPFHLKFVYFTELPRSKGGKLEPFICQVP